LLPLLIAEDETRVAVSELFSEGVAAPYVMLRRGQYKFTFVAYDPPQLFDLAADPDELHDLAADPAHASLVADLHGEVLRRWDLPALKEEILRSQRRRRLVYQALTMGRITPWDFQPQEDASKRYYRGTNSYHDAEERGLLDAPPPQ
jgi:choline-sulfatase